MPRKTKDTKTAEINLISKTNKTNSNSSDKKTTTSKKSAISKATTTTKNNTKKSTISKTSSTKKVNEIKKDTATTSKKKSTVAKKDTATVSKKKSSRKSAVKNEVFEYYDLPYRYNETIVKILAQTPKKLFVYWDISDADRQNYINEFGPDFFYNTKPVLIVHNDTMNYGFEVEINDFANCWYLDVNDTKCKYTIELGRRSKKHDYYVPNNYVYVTSSNVIESPNDHILFEKQARTAYFRNVKNNTTRSKDIANISFIRRMGKIYNIYDAYMKLYSEIYKDEDIINLNFNNPSSGNPTSTFK